VYENDDYAPYESVGQQLALILWITVGVVNVFALLLYFAL
jgi:hypothetical protein